MRVARHEERIRQTGGVSLASVATAIGAAASVASAVGAFGGKKQAAAPPPVAPPVVMPTPDDDAIKQVKRRSIAQQLSRSGRSSTFLSEPDGETLGA